MKTYVFDIDGTICTNTNGEYKLAEPLLDRIIFINKLYEEGNIIKFFTARGSTTGINWRKFTETQLKNWGAKYHELLLNKPEGDLYIDDKGFNCNAWIFPTNNNFNESKSEISKLKNHFFNHIDIANKTFSDPKIFSQLNNLIQKIKNTLNKKGKILLAGNGGSFADSQHIAAEFVARFNKDRVALPALALGTNSSNLTAIGNDYGFENIFSRELSAIGKKQDFLIALSTSGNSKNIKRLIEESENMGIDFYILTGRDGGELSKYGDSVIKVPSTNTAIIQQMHILLGHLICQNSESQYL